MKSHILILGGDGYIGCLSAVFYRGSAESLWLKTSSTEKLSDWDNVMFYQLPNSDLKRKDNILSDSHQIHNIYI